MRSGRYKGEGRRKRCETYEREDLDSVHVTQKLGAGTEGNGKVGTEQVLNHGLKLVMRYAFYADYESEIPHL